mgnify:CR=1 FL=1
MAHASGDESHGAMSGAEEEQKDEAQSSVLLGQQGQSDEQQIEAEDMSSDAAASNSNKTKGGSKLGHTISYLKEQSRKLAKERAIVQNELEVPRARLVSNDDLVDVLSLRRAVEARKRK